MSSRLSHNHFTLLAFTAVIFSSAWWQPYCQHKDKKLDLSRELNVPSISTILLIFHQSCGSSSEPWSYYSLREIASNWQAWELQWKFAARESCDWSWVWLGNLMTKSSNWFAKIESKQTGSGNSLDVNKVILKDHQKWEKVLKIVFFTRSESGNHNAIRTIEMQAWNMVWI